MRCELFKLYIQQFLGRLLLLPLALITTYLIRVKFKLKVNNLVEIRRQFKALLKDKTPIIVCANHLTMVDSVLIMWALASVRDYFFNYRLLCWNIPAIENYRSKPLWRIFTYLTKCIPINRKGGREHLDSIHQKLIYLISKGNLCMIFPEGTRSRSGRVNIENTTYGIGKIIRDVPGCQVLCVYLRADQQLSYSDFPPKADNLNMQIELIRPQSRLSGLRAIKDYSMQIILKIKEMEDIYFSKKSCVSFQ